MSISNLEYPNDVNIYVKSMDIGNTGTPFQKYVSTSYSSNLSGPFAAPIPISGGLYRQIDRTYNVSISGTTGTSTIAAPITFTSALSTNVWTDMYFPIWVTDNNVQVAGTLKIAGGTGIMTIYVGFNGNFSNVGTCGFPGFSVTFGSFLT
jgi:hypothetical protein